MATLNSMVWFDDLEVVYKGMTFDHLTVKPKKGIPSDPEPESIPLWVRRGSTVGLPVELGLSLCEDYGIKVVVDLAQGDAIPVRRLPDPFHPSAPPGQDSFFREVLAAMDQHYSLLVEAPTGSGKTVAMFNAIGRLKRSAVVVVPSRALATQWIKEAQKHLGLLPEEIGMIGDGVEDWEGKHVVVVVLHNLFQRIFPMHFYAQFGIAVWDECHNLGAREFSKVMRCFPASYKVGLSATPDRKDGCAEVFKAYFGPVRVKSTQEALPVEVKVIPFSPSPIPGALRYATNPTRALQFLARHVKRNELLTDLVVHLFKEGRQVLVLCKHVDHAEGLMGAVIDEGVPRGECGLFVGQRTAISKDRKRLRSLSMLYDYSPTLAVSYGWFMMLQRRKITNAELEVAKTKTVIFATYAMIKEGVDIPRLDAGVEASPVADARQVVGRVRRRLPGKPTPLWYTIADKVPSGRGMDFLYGFTRARLKGIEDTENVTIEYLDRDTL